MHSRMVRTSPRAVVVAALLVLVAVSLSACGAEASSAAAGAECLPYPRGLPDAAEGVVGRPLGEIWPEGLTGGHRPRSVAIATLRDPSLEGTWFAIGASIEGPEGEPVGVATWLMPDPIVSFAGEGAAGDPLESPENWHLYSWNDLAEDVSIWGAAPRVDLASDPVQAVTECLAREA